MTNWQTKKLCEIFQIERADSPRPIKFFLTTDDNGINWIKIGDTKNVTKYIYKTEEKIKPSGLNKTRLVIGYGKDELEMLQKMIDEEQSDLFDVCHISLS